MKKSTKLIAEAKNHPNSWVYILDKEFKGVKTSRKESKLNVFLARSPVSKLSILDFLFH